MKALKACMTHGLQKGSVIPTCDNSGAKLLRVISIKTKKTVKRRNISGGVADYITAAVIKGNPEMRKKVVNAVIVRQKKEYRRLEGIRVKFEDNAAVVVKDDKGTPKGTIVKGPIAKEVIERWPDIGKLASVIV